MITFWLTLVLLQANPHCPTAEDWAKLTVIHIPPHCMVPVEAYVLSSEKWGENKARIDGLNVIAKGQTKLKDNAEKALKECRVGWRDEVLSLQTTLKLVTANLKGCVEPVSGGTWGLVGLAGGYAACVGTILLQK